MDRTKLEFEREMVYLISKGDETVDAQRDKRHTFPRPHLSLLYHTQRSFFFFFLFSNVTESLSFLSTIHFVFFT